MAASEAPTLVEPVPARMVAPAPPKAAADPLRAPVPSPRVAPAPAVLPPVPPRPPAQKTGNHGALIAILALVIVIALAAGYWFVLRKPATQQAAATPTAPAKQPAETVSQAPQDTPPQPPDATDASQPPASTDTPADTAPTVDQGQTATARTVKPSAAKPSKPGYTQAHEAAQQALLAGKYFDPPESSALFWARKAKALGDPAAAQVEQQIFARQMSEISSARQSHNYDQARAQIYQLASNFPDHAELRQLQDDVHSEQQAYTQQLEDQRKKAEAASRVQKFAVQHRHGVGNSFCTGIITVNADGTARYDCSTADGGGRCEHVTFAPGSLKEAKIRGDGSLHVATKQAGNYDFVGGSMNLKDAATALGSLVGK